MAVSPWLHAADLLDPPVSPYAHDPVGYVREELGFIPWSKQAEIMEAVRDHPKVAVRSCHGVGKTAGAAQIALWFLASHPNSRVITTAPTWAQVEQLLWREIRASVGRAHLRGKGERFPAPSATKLELGVEWFAIGLSTNEPERFQGHHADHLLLIVDEASGVDERIFEAAEGFLTAVGAKVLLIGNPTRVGGQFHRAFTTERAQWRQVHISAYDSPNLTSEQVPPDVARSLVAEEWVVEKESSWGRGSPMFEVRVLGQFPSQASDAVVSLADVEDAQAREVHADPTKHRVVISCDVARFGDDETVIAVRIGDQVRIVESYVSLPAGVNPTVHTAGRLVQLARSYPDQHVRIVVDDDGLGGGVTDLVRERTRDLRMPWPVSAFRGGESAFMKDDYPNRRSEVWFAMRDRVVELDLDPDEQLAADLTSPTYKLDSSGRRVVEPKAETKKRLGRSPDRGDAVLLTLVPAGGQVVTEAPVPQAVRERRDPVWSSAGKNPLTERW